MISREEAREILDRQLDSGCAFAQLRRVELLRHRRASWEGGGKRESRLRRGEMWMLRVLRNGAWGGVVRPSHRDLLGAAARAGQLAATAAETFGRDGCSAKDSMVPKTVMAESAAHISGGDFPPAMEEVELFVDELCGGFSSPLLVDYTDSLVAESYWDSEGAEGAKSRFGASLGIVSSQDEGPGEGSGLAFHHAVDASVPFTLAGAGWKEAAAEWRSRIGQARYQGVALEDNLPWMFTPRAFAQLIQHTLAPTLSLERPNPFNPGMNPATVEGRRVAPAFLTVVSEPGLVSASPFLDDEGVLARSVTLIEDGVLRNFLASRVSAFRLGRSLSIRSERALAGSSRMDARRGVLAPCPLHIEVRAGGSLDEFQENHLLIADLEAEALDHDQDSFVIRARDSLVSKYGGLHQRSLPLLSFTASRNQIWGRLIALGRDRTLVHAPLRGARAWDMPSSFLVPKACFRGFSCFWA